MYKFLPQNPHLIFTYLYISLNCIQSSLELFEIQEAEPDWEPCPCPCPGCTAILGGGAYWMQRVAFSEAWFVHCSRQLASNYNQIPVVGIGTSWSPVALGSFSSQTESTSRFSMVFLFHAIWWWPICFLDELCLQCRPCFWSLTVHEYLWEGTPLESHHPSVASNDAWCGECN